MAIASEKLLAMGMTRALASFTVELRSLDISADVLREARCAIADCIGVALSGSQTAVARIAAKVQGGTEGVCSIWGSCKRASAKDAALVNGCAAHAHSLDDTHESMRGHPSAPIVPAVLAVAEEINADGHAVILSYLAGVEVAGRLGRSVNDRHSQLGWHTTSTLGTVGAAAACAFLLDLDKQQTYSAIAIACSMAGGLRVNFGTMTKALHAGLAAQHGVQAAQLAQSGMTGSEVALEGKEGFLALFCDDGSQSSERALLSLGESFELVNPGIVYKQYPTCSLIHALVDLVLKAREQGCFIDDEETEIYCDISERLETVRLKEWPATGLAAKFHVEYCVAVAACWGAQGVSDFTDQAVTRPEATAWAKRVRVRVGQRLPKDNGDIAELVIVRGGLEIFRSTQAKPKGHPSNRMSENQHKEKFMQNATAVLSEQGAAEAWRLLNASQICSARELAAVLTAQGLH